MKKHTTTKHTPFAYNSKGQQIHTVDRKRGVRYESDRLITKHVQENGIYYASDERGLSDDGDDELDDDSPGKKSRQRKQADAFRKAEADSIDAAEEDASAPIAKPKRSRLRHSDEGNGFASKAGNFGKKTAAVAAAPLKHYLRHEAEEYDRDNAALDAVSSGASSAKLIDGTVHKMNGRGSSGSNKLTEHTEKNAAELEKRKKDEIRMQLKKKRHRAAIEVKRGNNAPPGSLTEMAYNVMSVPERAKKAVKGFFAEHKGLAFLFIIAAILFLLLTITLVGVTSVFQSSSTPIIGTSYLSSDADIYAAEKVMCDLEDSLNAQINSFEKKHPGYDEYVYQIDEIEHNPYQLISYLQVKFGEFACDKAVKNEIKRLFESQYIISVSEKTETRTRMEPVTKTRSVYDDVTGKWKTEKYTEEEEVAYDYRICYCVLTNRDFNLTARGNMTADESEWYMLLNMTYGNRDYLFDKNSIGAGITPGAKYEIPPEALSDEKFAAIIREAEKYLGYPYVLGGKSPKTSFDCSGFVCWVLNHCDNNWNVGSKRAKDLCKMCIYVSPSEARPGDLIFFEKTYETSGASHVGIYVGNGMMLHCGNPIKYSSINTRYFKEHFLCFGRLPFYDK